MRDKKFKTLPMTIRETEKRRKTLSKIQRNEWAIFRLRD